MATAIWSGAVLARSDGNELVESNVYFQPASLDRRYFRDCNWHSHRPWEGDTSYCDIEVNGAVSPAAVCIRDYAAFWNGVEVME
ncbi:MAG: DUF427 domain-containing protein [Gammaproteobacteria bacterium]|jgi:uncharacterized protein (DUF427 family)